MDTGRWVVNVGEFWVSTLKSQTGLLDEYVEKMVDLYLRQATKSSWHENAFRITCYLWENSTGMGFQHQGLVIDGTFWC